MDSITISIREEEVISKMEMNLKSIISYQSLLRFGQEYLEKRLISEAANDGWLLFSYITGFSRAEYFMKQQDMVSQGEKNKYWEMLEKRGQHIPLQYITSVQEFMGLPFFVNQDVLIPRQDTECLVEKVLPYVKGKDILDMCTGSGCIAISLAVMGDTKSCTGVDFSAKALEVAKKNAKEHQTDILWIESDLFDRVEGRYDVIVSNPPYIPPKVIEGLMEEVRDYEPMLALDGGEDGLDFYRRITKDSLSHLNNGGWLFYEIGHDQGTAVVELMKDAGFSEVICSKDYAGNDRIVSGRR